MPKIFPYISFRQCFNRTHDLIFWPLSFINKLATINRYYEEFCSGTFPYTPGPSFLWFGWASCSSGRCSGPSTLINVVGKRNLNGINVYLRWRSERDTLDQRWSTFMVLNKAHVEPEAQPNQRKLAPSILPTWRVAACWINECPTGRATLQHVWCRSGSS